MLRRSRELASASKPHTFPVTHPVLDVLHARLREGSAPGARSDPHRVAVVLEGGGMRGVVSAGMTAALERLGLTRCFDLVVGSSAGALNAAALRRRASPARRPRCTTRCWPRGGS